MTYVKTVYYTRRNFHIYQIHRKEIRLPHSDAALRLIFILLRLFGHSGRRGEIAAGNGGDAGAD